MSILDFIRRQILRYRDLLANLSRKNKELFYREGRAHCINLSKSPDVSEEFEELISEKFRALRATSSLFQDLLNKSSLDLSNHFLLDETNNTELVKRLDKVRLADDKFQREYGISGAWLLGPFLCWRDTSAYKSDEILISPIFKIAVDISKDKRKRWGLKLEESALHVNPSLRLALRQKWGILLPEQFECDQVSEALEELKRHLEQGGKKLIIESTLYDSVPKIPPRFKIIKDEQGEIVNRVPINLEEVLSKKDFQLYSTVTHLQFVLIDIMLIDHLNASRTVLLRDYDSILEEAEMHPILSELFLGKPIPHDREDDDYERIKMLDGYKERDNHFVVNIDSSQHRAIDQTTKSQVVVIQGPPGTGKSQTITNLIAEALAKGKKVLFVSEKRAALDVVYSRLQQANLASQAVLIHSSDLNKQNLYNSFLELSDSVHDTNTDQQWDIVTDEFDKRKSEINAYYQILGMKHFPSGLFISDLLSYAACVLNNKVNIELAKFFSIYSYVELQQICSMLNELQGRVKKVSAFSNHPWLFRKNTTIYTNSFILEVNDLIDKLKSSENSLNEIKNKIIALGINDIDVLPSRDILEKIIKSEISSEWIAFASVFYTDQTIFSVYKKELDAIIQTIENEINYFNQINKNADVGIIKELESYYSLKHSFVEWFSPTYWKMRNYRSQCISNWDGTNRPFKAYRLIHEAIKSFKLIAHNKLLPVNIEDSNPQAILDAYQILLPIAKCASDIGVTIKNLVLLKKDRFSVFNVDTYSEIKKYFVDILRLQYDFNEALSLLEKQKKILYDYFEKPLVLEKLNSNSLTYDNLIQTISDLVLLDQVDLCLGSLQKILKENFSKQMLIDHLIPIEIEWGQYVLSIVIRWWLDEALSKNHELRNFDREDFQRKIEEFKKLEDDHRVFARNFVNNTFSKRWKKGLGEFEGLSLLRKEANKQRKVLPPREIMERGALSAMLKLKPCWLMSPLSISQVLPIKTGLFDIIIFDEASQVRVEDAIPSIYRAGSMVVVGDPKQMPPTNFFSASEFIDDDDEDEETELTASILDLASQIYPTEILEWHYRSRSEALIAFSNRAFYGGRLIAVPNPYFITEGDVIKFHKINNAYFNQKNGNSIEAEAVVNRLAELLATTSNQSFGIIAMGQAQMLAIEDAIDKRKLSDLKFQNAIEQSKNYLDGEADAGLFIKNLENVQGDERDIILISVGYAPSSPGKKVYLNFGPLSKQGGGRRLNVAITRAKKKIEIFCSFDPNQIPTEEKDFGKNPDLVLFGRYLKYANAISEKQYAEAKAILESFGVGAAITTRPSSNFSKDVQRRLEELGYKVSSEIGSSGFYIDLGIHHPVIPSNFILGIECDGALFHSTPYARDRDKIRQELLESRGWKIIRVWSQDWSRDWKSEVTKLDNVLKQILDSQTMG